MSKMSVMAIGAGLISGRTNTYNDFTVYTHRPGVCGLSVGIDGPSRAEIKYTDLHDGSIKVSYMAHTPGEYNISVKYDGINVRGSPYTVRVRGDEPFSSRTKSYFDSSPTFGSSTVSNAGRVRVSGRGLYSGITHVSNEVEIDVRDAGPGRLHWSIEGPGHVESRNRGIENGKYKLYYKPDAPGEYCMRIKYDDKEVYGSPFRIRVL